MLSSPALVIKLEYHTISQVPRHYILRVPTGPGKPYKNLQMSNGHRKIKKILKIHEKREFY